ncbi:hypothetical protein EBT31_02820 [bacterium]|nr:hypothetical protein [bacterium]
MVELVSIEQPPPKPQAESQRQEQTMFPPAPEPRMVENNHTDSRLNMEFSTPIQEVMGGADFEPEETVPVIDDRMIQRPRKEGYRAEKEIPQSVASAAASKNPFGLTDDQFQAALAGLAAVIAFSKPMQDKIAEVLPQVVGQGLVSQAFMLALTAVIFMLAKRFLAGK